MERKERILRKALKLYGVEDEGEQNGFIEDITKLEAEEPEDEEIVEDKVEEKTEEAAVETEKVEVPEAEEKVEEPTEPEVKEEEQQVQEEPQPLEPEVKEEEKVVEQEPQVDYSSKINALEETIKAQNDQIAKLYEMVSALGVPCKEEQVGEYNPFGNQKVEPSKRTEEDDDAYLRVRLGGSKY